MDGRNSQYIADESNTIKRIGGIYDNEKENIKQAAFMIYQAFPLL